MYICDFADRVFICFTCSSKPSAGKQEVCFIKLDPYASAEVQCRFSEMDT